ncbi:hypothetical protein BLOT_004067 [Blomia tropicalis]|nr:hypothetical protein BLOT_004067 [Blomia tropicalis]
MLGEVRHRHHKPKIQVQGQEIDSTTKREINTKVSKFYKIQISTIFDGNFTITATKSYAIC